MKEIVKGDRTNFNFQRVLRSIWLSEGISRIEICQKLDIDKATISTIVSFLLKNQIVQEFEKYQYEVKPGRKPIGLAINKKFGYILGFEYSMDGLSTVVTDMHHNIILEKKFPQKIDYTNIDSVFFDAFEEIKNSPELRDISILGVGVAIPGIVDHDNGIILKSWELGIEKKPFNIAQKIFDKLKIPCFIDNDANCCAWGVLAARRTMEYKNFLFAYFRFESFQENNKEINHLGMGLGIVINGNLYFGSESSAGEFQSITHNNKSINQFSLTHEELSKYKTDPYIQRKLFKEVMSHLALFINIMNFKQLFIGGDLDFFPNDSENIVSNAINFNWPYDNVVDCDIHIYRNDKGLATSGAAGMFLERLFTIPDLTHGYESKFWQRIFEIKESSLSCKMY